MREALPLYRETVRLQPDFWIGYNNIMYALAGLGDEEGVVRVGEQMIKAAGGRPGRAAHDEDGNYQQEVWDLPAERAEQIEDMDSHGGIGTSATVGGAINLAIALFEAQMHDVGAA